jgi:hypothetical protein
MEEWLSIYRTYDSAALDAEIALLKTQAANFFNAMTEGDRSYARSTLEIRTRLAAATQVRQENSSTTASRHGFADFSGVRP